MIRTRKDFVMQKMPDSYLIIAVGDSADTYHSIIETNGSGAFYWEMLEKGTTEKEMIEAAMARYEGLDEETARTDLSEFLEMIDAAIIREEKP